MGVAETNDARMLRQLSIGQVLKPAFSFAVNDLHTLQSELDGVIDKVVDHLRDDLDWRAVQVEQVGDDDRFGQRLFRLVSG